MEEMSMSKPTESREVLTSPAFLPVTTFGGKFPLDEVVRPHLFRFASALMVSYHYATKMAMKPNLPLFVDSGGFASLFEGSEILEKGEVAFIRTKEGSVIHPREVLSFQEKHAAIGATLDFLIPPGLHPEKALQRQELSIRNARWALKNRRNKYLKLYASIQAWDQESALRCTKKLARHPFDGFALGGMVPRVSQPDTILSIVHAIRMVDQDRPLHVFGIGQPNLVRRLFEAGVNSVDSSSYVRLAVEKKYLSPQTGQYSSITDEGVPKEDCSCRICQSFPPKYLTLSGELNTMALALHNLIALNTFLGIRHNTI